MKIIAGTACFLFAALLASPARGGLSLDFDVLMDDSGYDVSYTLYLEAEAETDQVARWSGGVTGPMRQVWLAGELPTPALSAAALLAPELQSKDSHFLVSDVDLYPGKAFSETASDMTAMTGSLTGAFSLLPEAMATRLPLAQVLTPHERRTELVGQATTRAGDVYNIRVGMVGWGEALGFVYGGSGWDSDILQVGQPVSFFGEAHAQAPFSYTVYRVLENAEEPMLQREVVASSRDRTFSFTPTVAGEYGVVIMSGNMPVGGPMPSPGFTFTVVPEPTALGLLAAGMLAAMRKWRR